MNAQYRDTGNIGHTRQRTKSNKAMKKNKNQHTYTTQQTTCNKVSSTDPTKNTGVNPNTREG